MQSSSVSCLKFVQHCDGKIILNAARSQYFSAVGNFRIKLNEKFQLPIRPFHHSFAANCSILKYNKIAKHLIVWFLKLVNPTLIILRATMKSSGLHILLIQNIMQDAENHGTSRYCWKTKI
jgi:hypothetical protein